MPQKSSDALPHHSSPQMLLATLRAVESLGGSASINEIADAVAASEGFSDETVSQLHGNGPETELRYRLAWSRTYLKGIGLLANSARGVWTLTDDATVLLRQHALDSNALLRRLEVLRDEWVETYRRRGQTSLEEPTDDDAAPSPDWQAALLEVLMTMDASAFERLSMRILREAGFDNVKVTGKTGDGGIDGTGVYRLGLVSIPVFFQSKRYRGSVGASTVRDFRGAMQGRGDKGLVITTGTFTADATREATRDGAPTVDLIDGESLIALLKKYELGVVTELVETVSIDHDFFGDL